MSLPEGWINPITAIQVNRDAIINDGHHAIRAAVEEGRSVDVLIIAGNLIAGDGTILDVPVE